MKFTLRHIAEKANVSISLVSKVLNDKKVSVSQEKRERILRIANEYKQLEEPAKYFTQTKTRSEFIALIQPNLKFDFLANLTEGIENRANQLGYNVIVLNSGEDPAKEREYLELCENNFIKGVIVNACDNNANIDYFKYLNKRNFPMVFVDRYIPDQNFSFVTTDNYTGAYKLTKMLIERGHRNILFVFHGKSLFTTGQLDRYSGYQQAVSEHNLDSMKEYVYSDRPLESQPICKDLNNLNNVDAIFLATSWDILYLLKVIHENGRRFGKKMDIATYDSFSIKYPSDLKLDLLKQHVNELFIMEQNYITIATKTVDLLTDQINHRNSEHTQIKIAPSMIIANGL